ncbi:hypothetical protein DFH09DRAFT_1082310 [Mycena vulgaris]|nr:hypothetical protein DFH09DRAFT_1082310 [Mycena vulgaris]
MNHAATPTPTARLDIIHVDSPATRPGASFDPATPRAPEYRSDFTSSPRANILSPSRSRDAEPNKCLPRGAPNPNKPRLNFHFFTFKFTFQVEFKLRVQVQAFKFALKAKVEGAEPDDDEPEALRAEEKRFTHPFPGALNENQADLEAASSTEPSPSINEGQRTGVFSVTFPVMEAGADWRPCVSTTEHWTMPLVIKQLVKLRQKMPEPSTANPDFLPTFITQMRDLRLLKVVPEI